MSDPVVELVTRDGLERRIGEIKATVDLGIETKARVQQIVAAVYIAGDAVANVGGVDIAGLVLSPASNTGNATGSVLVGGIAVTGPVLGGSA